MPLAYHKAILGFVRCIIESMIEAKHMLGNTHKKVFSQGAYALVDKNTKINHKAHSTYISRFYVVYNSENNKIWPVNQL